MKKVLSLAISLILLVSSFAVTAVAFADEPIATADETPSRTIGFDSDKFIEYVLGGDDEINANYFFEMSKTFMLSNNWLKDATKVGEIFSGIQYFVLEPEADDLDEQDEYTLTYVYNSEDTEYTDETAPKEADYKVTKHITLRAALKAKAVEEGETEYEFAGWEVKYQVEGKPETVEYYRAGEEISMPAADVTVTAQWVEKDSGEKLEFEHPVNDVIYVLYTTPSEGTKDDDDWNYCLTTDTISMQTSGEWFFKYVVVDGEKASEPKYEFDKKDVLNKESYVLERYAVDNTHPVVDLSEDMKKTVEEGLTVGKKYKILTSLEITENSSASTTVTYEVYKKVGTGVEGADSDGWLLIYDSEGEVTKGYEDCINDSGEITPLASDVSNDPVYKIRYSVKDDSGYWGVEDEALTERQFNPTMYLKVKLSDDGAKDKARVEAWKIVLYVIAGLSAVGIVVVLCIKPKQTVSADGRYMAAGDNKATDDKSSDDKEE